MKLQLWKNNSIPFYDESLHTGVNADSCTIVPYLINDGKKHGMVVIMPGGGYVKISTKETVPVARYINSIGMHAVVVNYRVLPYDPQLGVIDGKRAVRYVKGKLDEWNILENAVGIMGFSAGAGNAALVCERYDIDEYEACDDIDALSARPDFCILCYGALSLDTKHLSKHDIDNFRYICPDDRRNEYIADNSPDKHIRSDMPPAFIWHAADDTRVCAGATLSFVNALYEHHIDTEFHLYPYGGHGKSVLESREIPDLRNWMPTLTEWLRRRGYIKELKVSTLCYIKKEDSYLMLHRVKKDHDVNKGKWIGVGGKLEDRETPRECVIRECLEETGLTLKTPQFAGLVHFISDIHPNEDMYVYTCSDYSGEVNYNCDEGILKWIHKDDIYKLPMWEGDKIFLDYILNDKTSFEITIEYSGEELIRTSL